MRDNGNNPSITLGVDLGGTKVKSALVSEKGRILAEITYPTHPEKGAGGVITDILRCVEKCFDTTSRIPGAVGVGVAGQVDPTGVVRSAPNLGWRDVPLKDVLEERLGLPVIVVNDVRAATWGEWHYGSGKNVNDLILLFIGTGIGGGVVSNGRILTGCNNTAGELGHMTIVVGGRQCHCPNMGCLEAYAGGWAIAERAQEAARTQSKAGESLIALAGSLNDITAATVSQAYHNGDKLAQQLVEKTAEYLAAGTVGIINAFNPCLLAFGGGVIDGLPELVTLVDNVIRQRGLRPAIENLHVKKVTLGSNAGVIGAAALAKRRIGES